jgi:hypothetical protein
MRLRQLFILAAGLVVLGSASPATAATFQQMPATYNQSGVGPFTYFFRSTTPESHSWVAWKFSAEEFWHRCQRPSDVSFSNLPDGRYSIEITDDVNSDWYAARGQGSSGHTAPCRADPPPPPDGLGYATHSFYVDTVAPWVGAPRGRAERARGPRVNRRLGCDYGGAVLPLDDGRRHRADYRRAPSAAQVSGGWGLASLGRRHRLRRQPGERLVHGLRSPRRCARFRRCRDASAVDSVPQDGAPQDGAEGDSKGVVSEGDRGSCPLQAGVLAAGRAYRRNPTASTTRAASKAKKRMLLARRMARKRCTFRV